MHSCSLCNLRAQGLALRNMHSLHVSTIFWFLACLWWEHDYNAVPFECWFITQSPCKCDCSLSQESIKQPQYIISFFFLFATDHIFFALLGAKGYARSLGKKLVLVAQNSCLLFETRFPEYC